MLTMTTSRATQTALTLQEFIMTVFGVLFLVGIVATTMFFTPAR